jgi:hypothetical protein
MSAKRLPPLSFEASFETTRFHFIGKQYMEKNLKGSDRLVCQP